MTDEVEGCCMAALWMGSENQPPCQSFIECNKQTQIPYPLLKVNHGDFELRFDSTASPCPIIVYPPRAIPCSVHIVLELGYADLLRSAMVSKGNLPGHSRRQESQESKCETE